MPRLVRRQSLFQRISTAINPWDFLLWLSEEIETRELDSQSVGTRVGLVANFLFLLARANLGPSNDADDDVFGDGSSSGWLSYLMQLLVWTGFSLSVANAIFVFTRKRYYRLFEANIDKGPSTPSAQRVRVQSSPSASTPLRLLSDFMSFETAESRAHPDGTRDVWELAIWDPRPASLELLSFFSPLHVLIYLFELPLDPLEARPSVAVFKCLVLQVGLSAVMKLVQSKNDQRAKDNAIIQREVFHEYDTKFVQPRLHPVIRDVGTQVTMNDILGAGAGVTSSQIPVESGRPTTLIRRSFQTHPNANYLKHIDPDYVRPSASSHRTGTANSSAREHLITPASKPARYSDSFTPGYSSVAQSRQGLTVGVTSGYSTADTTPGTVGSGATGMAASATRQTMTSSGTNTGHGGNLGVFSHVNSPLKKAISMSDITGPSGTFSPRNSRELAAAEQRESAERMQRKASPIKEDRTQQSPAAPNPFARARTNPYKYERFPSRR